MRRWRDLVAACAIAAAVGGSAWVNHGRIDEGLFTLPAGNVWFQADPWRVIQNETLRDSDHYRDIVHPLYSLLTFPIAAGTQLALDLDPHAAVRLFHTLVAALWAAALYATLRACGRSILEATLFAVLGAASAASLFWLCVPETYALGSITILAAAAAAARREPLAFWPHVALNAATLSVTVTNWMAGILATAARAPLWRGLRAMALAFAIVCVLAVVQKAVFPTSQLFFYGSNEELNYILTEEAGGVWATLRAMLFHAMALPEIRTLPGVAEPWRILSVQLSTIASGGALTVVAAAAWATLLGMGAAALLASKERRLALVLAGIAAGQLLLHALYGDETFLYSLHLMPVLIVIASFGVRIAPRSCIALAALLVLSAGTNNLLRLREAQALVREGAGSSVPTRPTRAPEEPRRTSASGPG